MGMESRGWFFEACHTLFGAFWKAGLWGSAFIAISLLMPPIWLAGFLRELGFAFIIGAIITIGIEEIARRKHNALVAEQMATVNRNVIEAVYGRRFPNSIFDHIEQTILDQPLVRKDLEVTFNFSRLLASRTRLIDATPLLIKVSATYSVHNLRRTPETYKPYIFLEKPWPADLVKHVRINRFSVNGVDLSSEDIDAANAKEPDTPNYIKFIFGDIPLPAGTSRPRKGATIELEYQFIKLARDATTWRTVLPCEECKLTIVYSSEFELFYTSIHSNSIIEYGPTQTSGVKQLKFNGPLLPQNGLEIWWRPGSVKKRRGRKRGRRRA